MNNPTRSSLVVAILFTVLALTACARAADPALFDDQDLGEYSRTVVARVQAELGGIDYGFAPLLLDPGTRVTVGPDPETGHEVAFLDYPDQPADPGGWPALDCFAYAYAVRYRLAADPQVADVALGLIKLTTNIGDDYQDLTATHVYAWVTFVDGHTAAVDLTPLAAVPLNPRHAPSLLREDAGEIEKQFGDWRRRAPLRKGQPMLVATRDGKPYYLLAGVAVLPDEYQFILRVYQMQPATSDRPLQFGPAALVGLRFGRPAFAEVQPVIVSDGPAVFDHRPDLLTRVGDPDPALAAVLDEHLYLLWHLVAKFREPSLNASVGSPESEEAPLVRTPAYINPGHVVIEPGGVARFTPEPVGGTPESRPILTIRITLVDARTGHLVRGDVSVNGDVIYRNVSQFTLELPGQTDDVIYLAIEAEGYETWSQGYRYRLEHSRTWEIVVKMDPTAPTPAPGPVGSGDENRTG